VRSPETCPCPMCQCARKTVSRALRAPPSRLTERVEACPGYRATVSFGGVIVAELGGASYDRASFSRCPPRRSTFNNADAGMAAPDALHKGPVGAASGRVGAAALRARGQGDNFSECLNSERTALRQAGLPNEACVGTTDVTALRSALRVRLDRYGGARRPDPAALAPKRHSRTVGGLAPRGC
jgi:hypothetical protein